jgi:hypothetical protein
MGKAATKRTERASAAGQAERVPGTVVVDSQGSVRVALKLSDPAAKADVAALQREITRNRTQAAAFLREAGILTPSGKLSRRFGG